MDFWDALYELGVRDDMLTIAEKEQLDGDGYLPLEGVFTREHAARMLETHKKLWEIEGTGQEGKADSVVNAQNKCGSDVYDICFTHPRVLAAVAHVLKEEFLSMGVHPAGPHWPPGDENQGLHTDCRGKVSSGKFYCCNSMWPLMDFTDDNGPTRVIPGSHLFGAIPSEALDDCVATHPDEVKLIIPVGTVVIFNAHLWHSATANPKRIPRANLTSFWSRRVFDPDAAKENGIELREGNRCSNHLSQDAFDRLSEAARCLFDPPDDEDSAE